MSTIAHWKRRFKSCLDASAVAQSLLSKAHVEAHCRRLGHRWRESFWSPSITLTAFLLQQLNATKTLRAAVADLLAGRAAIDPHAPLPSDDPSAFAQARRRVPEAVIAAVLDDVTRQFREHAAVKSWKGRRTVLIDGTFVSMPDEPALQREFPQPKAQKPGCGFPLARVVAIFCWGCGALLALRIGSRHDGELAVFRMLLDMLMPGDVALADRAYSSYVDVARMAGRGVDVAVRMHQARRADFRAGRRLGPEDRIVAWRRPGWSASCGLSREEFAQLPEEMTLRMVRTTDVPTGFRSREIVVVTTILDPREASREELLALYRDRWTVELNLRSLKTTLGMDVLRGRSVDVVRKELLMHALAYNLIRLFMREAAGASGREPRRLSFAGTLHRLRSVAAHLLLGARRWDHKHDLLALLIGCVADDPLPDRPERVEPRRRKRRPKQYSLMTKPRAHYRIHGDKGCR